MSASSGNVIELPTPAAPRPAAAAPVPTAGASAVAASPSTSAARAHEVAQRAVRVLAQWLPQVRYRVLQLGPAGLTGASSMTLAVLAGLLFALPAHRAEVLLHQQLLHAPASATSDGGSPATPAQLLATLPARAEVPAVLGEVLKVAQQSGIVLEKGHYDYRAPQAATPGRYSLEFPVKGPYLNVRNFIDHTLSAVPAVALEKLRIERKAVGDAAINADVTFSLYVRGD